MTFTAVFVGGPLHGDVRAMPGEVLNAPREYRFPTFNGVSLVRGEAVYRRAEKADTPGRVAYMWSTEAASA
jgi:hypothetical protein